MCSFVSDSLLPITHRILHFFKNCHNNRSHNHNLKSNKKRRQLFRNNLRNDYPTFQSDTTHLLIQQIHLDANRYNNSWTVFNIWIQKQRKLKPTNAPNMKKPKWKIIATVLFFLSLTAQCHKQEKPFFRQTHQQSTNYFQN